MIEERRRKVWLPLLVVVALATSVAATGQQSSATKPTCFAYDPATLRVIADGATSCRVLAGGEMASP